MSKLQVAKLTQNAYIPIKGSRFSAGIDLFSAYDYLIKSRDKGIVKTDLQIKLPKDSYGRIASRSSLTVKYSIFIGAGVIDSDYTGNVTVILFNFGNQDFTIKKGDRIAQLICERFISPNIEVVNELSPTERGPNGFGSTGI